MNKHSKTNERVFPFLSFTKITSYMINLELYHKIVTYGFPLTEKSIGFDRRINNFAKIGNIQFSRNSPHSLSSDAERILLAV